MNYREMRNKAQKDHPVGTIVCVTGALLVDKNNTGRIRDVPKAKSLLGCRLKILEHTDTSFTVGPACDKSRKAFQSVGSTYFWVSWEYVTDQNKLLFGKSVKSGIEGHLRGLIS